jgi:uracil-DNA glycosylase family 4
MEAFFRKILLADQDRDLNSSYSVFKKEIEKTNLIFDNVLMNRWGPVKVANLDNALNRAFLFVDNDVFLQKDINQLMLHIRLLKNNKTSLTCHPTGYLKKGNIMVVGEAPGRLGEGLNKDFLKPTFIFTRTSQVLRNALLKANIKTPYITNICKYALSDNKVTVENFEQCWDIFEKELELLQPSNIICLGKKVQVFLTAKGLHNKHKLINKVHPAYALYKQLKEGVYEEQFAKDL